MSASVPPPSSIIELLDDVRDRHQGRVALQELTDQGVRTMTYDELARQRSRLSAFLMEQGVKKGDRVAILSEGRMIWGAAFFGVLEVGGVIVPLDVKLKEPEFVNLLRHSDASALLVSGKYEAMAAALKTQAPSLAHVLSLEERSDRYPCLGALPPGAKAASRRSITDDDAALIVYTSGTTGLPKGVEITCGNLRFEVEAFAGSAAYVAGDQFLSILPVNHLFEITGGFLAPLYYGGTITYCHSFRPNELLKAMQQTGTTVMLAVPLILKMLHEGVMKELHKLPQPGRTLAHTLFRLSQQLDRRGIHLGHRFFPAVRKKFGGRLRGFISGGAPLDPAIAQDFWALGLPVLQGYGLTETAPVLASNSLKANRVGSVGQALPGVDIEIRRERPEAPDGEIVVRGPNVMRGYYKNPEATAEVLREGWFHTGDLGYLDRDGFLFISGRLKNLIVTGGGKKVQPEEIEELYARSPFIRELCILGRPAGEGLKAGTEEVYAVIVPDEDHFKKSGVPFEPAAIRASIESELAAIGKGLAEYKRPVDFDIWMEELPKTATKKIKRPEVKKRVLDQAGSQG
jgi:long-chain acyl-CoA synthetase